MKVFNLLLVVLMLSLVVMVGGCGSKFKLTALDLSPEVCYRGETVTVSATVAYSGDVRADYEAKLKVDGTVERTGIFSFEPGASEILSFNLSRVEPGSYTVQLSNLKSSFTVLGASNFNISPDEVEIGQPVTVTADLQNVTGDEVLYCCCLFCQGEEVQSKNITIAADSTSTVTFDLAQSSGGWYEVELLGFSESFKVLNPAELLVLDLEVAPNPVKVGGATTITAEIENVGDMWGADELSLIVDGVVKETKEIALAPGAVTTESFSLSGYAEGSYRLQIGAQQVELRVVQPVRLSTGTVLLNELPSGISQLRVINEEDSDLVVIMASPEKPEIPLWAGYVRAGAYHTFRQIAEDTYIIYYVFGEDWDEEAKKFLTVYSYERFADEIEFEEATYIYTRWTLPFNIGGIVGLPSWVLDEDEFPSLE